VTDVTSNLNAEITSDGSRGRVSWVGGSQHHSSSLDSIETLPNHGEDWTTSHVFDQTTKERLGGEVSIVVLEVVLRGLHELHGHQLEAFVLEPLDDLSADATVNGIRLDHDEGSLSVSGHCQD